MPDHTKILPNTFFAMTNEERVFTPKGRHRCGFEDPAVTGHGVFGVAERNEHFWATFVARTIACEQISRTEAALFHDPADPALATLCDDVRQLTERVEELTETVEELRGMLLEDDPPEMSPFDEWMAQNEQELHGYAGQVVAIHPARGVVEHDASFEEVYDRVANANLIDEVTLHIVPSEDGGAGDEDEDSIQAVRR